MKLSPGKLQSSVKTINLFPDIKAFYTAKIDGLNWLYLSQKVIRRHRWKSGLAIIRASGEDNFFRVTSFLFVKTLRFNSETHKTEKAFTAYMKVRIANN